MITEVIDMHESEQSSTSWIKYILSGLVACFFALLGIQMRAQENVDSIQNRDISEIKEVVKQQEKIIIFLKTIIEERRYGSDTP